MLLELRALAAYPEVEIQWVYTYRLSTSGGVGCTRSPQSHSGSMLLGLRALAAYPEVEIQWV